MSKTGLKIVLPDSVTDTTLRKLDHYYGITFKVGESNQGGDNGYYELIGNDELRKEMRFHNLFKPCRVKDCAIVEEIDQTKFSSYDLTGADGSDILWCATQDIYSIDGAQVDGVEIRAISDQPFSYNGISATKHAAYGECLDYMTVKDGVARSIRDDSVAGTQSASSSYVSNLSDTQYGDTAAGGYPRTLMTLYTTESYARLRNDDSTSNYPYAPYNNIDYELLETLLMIEFRTKNIEQCVGYGVTALSQPDAATWGKTTGIRMTADNGTNYTYGTFNTILYPGGNTTGYIVWNILNGSCPLFKIFEPQIKVSDGATFDSVIDADGNAVQGLSSGIMTGVYTKTFSFEFTGALSSGGTAQTYTVEVCLREPIYRGRHLGGHQDKWCSGYEALQWLDDNGATHHEIFRAPSIDVLVTDSDGTAKTSKGEFSFETAYNSLGEIPTNTTTYANIYAKTCLTDNDDTITTIFAKEGGATGGTYENAVTNMMHQTVSGSYFRRVGILGVSANGPSIFRSATINYPITFTYSSLGSGFRVALNV